MGYWGGSVLIGEGGCDGFWQVDNGIIIVDRLLCVLVGLQYMGYSVGGHGGLVLSEYGKYLILGGLDRPVVVVGR